MAIEPAAGIVGVEVQRVGVDANNQPVDQLTLALRGPAIEGTAPYEVALGGVPLAVVGYNAATRALLAATPIGVAAPVAFPLGSYRLDVRRYDGTSVVQTLAAFEVATGVQGAPGPRGLRGETGVTGPDGLVGLTGATGATGAIVVSAVVARRNARRPDKSS